MLEVFVRVVIDGESLTEFQNALEDTKSVVLFDTERVRKY